MADTTTLDEPVPGQRNVRALEGLPLLGARYRVLGMLGGGGMGNVYLAHDTELDENVAVKLLKASLSERPEQVDLLRREVKLARRVTHPNVLRTFDIGDHEGSKFITMELVDGGTLNDLLPRKMPLVEVARIAQAVCAGLGAAHDAGILHRDLKPSNVMLGTDGRILLSDFGISRLADAPADGQLAGTPGYMAPELLCNEPVDVRADIWALGALLYEMLAGARAFAYRRGEDLLGPVLRGAPDPSALRPDLPIALARVVTRCMARQPAARFAHPREIAAAISGALPLPATSSTGSSPFLPVATSRRVRVLAVLPLESRAGPNDAHLAEGLTAVLIDGIDSRELRVPSRSAVEAAHPAGRDPLEVGRDLGAEAVVTGAVGASPSGGMRIELRVTGTGDGLVLFAETFECALGEVVRVAEKASRSIARALLVERGDATGGIDDSQAVELYLQGVQEYRRRWEGSVERSAVCFKRALERAPDDPMVLSAYALALARRLAFVGDDAAISEARTVSKRALALARDRPEAHLGVGAVELQLANNVEAARALRLAIAIAPHHADAHQMIGLLEMETCSVDRGLAHLYTAITLDPTFAHAKWWIGRGHALLGEWGRCDAIFEQPLGDPHGLNDYWVNRARTVLYGPTPERRAKFETDFASAPEFDMRRAIETSMGIFHGRQPSPAIFAPYLTRAHSSDRRTAFTQTLLAELAAVAGDVERAMTHVLAADAARTVDVVWLETCAPLGKLRSHRDYAAVHARVSARAAAVRAALDGGEA